VVTSEADLFCKTFIQLYQDQKVPRNSLTVIGSAGIGKSCTSVLLIYRCVSVACRKALPSASRLKPCEGQLQVQGN
jgi:hypothetical protein